MIRSRDRQDSEAPGKSLTRIFAHRINMTRLPSIALVAAALWVVSSCSIGSERPVKRPNILFIFIDDLGWMDVACQGNKLVETPNIDRLAKQGMRFTDAYAAAPVCSPTRAAVLTGLAPARLGITNHLPDQKRFTPKNAKLGPAECIDHLGLEYVTIAERLKTVGYRTAFMGKWHICGDWSGKDGGKGDARYHPEHQGFDINIGGNARGGPSTFFDPYNIYALPDRKKGEYLPYRLADEAIAFLEQSKRDGKPFYLNLSHYTVHWPMEAPDELLKKYKTRTGPGLNDTRYGAMIEAMDKAVGRVLTRLDELGLADNTLVVFTSDNGGYSGVADNRPLRKGKGFLYEGGTRVPLIVRWPGVTSPATMSAEPVISMDFFPTFLTAVGLRPDPASPLDGCDLTPILRGSGDLGREAIYFHYPNYAFHGKNRLGGAIRAGRHKLILHYGDDSAELYDLSADISETRDLSAALPAKTAELKGKLKAWLRDTGAKMPRRLGSAK
jgi:arylsulfatase A